MAMRTILLMNGPNLDMLGTREPEVYGSQTLQDIETMVAGYAGQLGVSVSRFQSNSEGDLINVIHHAAGQFDGIVYNPGAHTHYSYALRDAIAGCDIPVVEVHMSDVDQREAFRRISVIAPACIAQVKGLGAEGYCRAVDILCEMQQLVRLGEGFEQRFAADASIRIAGQEQTTATNVDGASVAQEQMQTGFAAEGVVPDEAGMVAGTSAVPAQAQEDLPVVGMNAERPIVAETPAIPEIAGEAPVMGDSAALQAAEGFQQDLRAQPQMPELSSSEAPQIQEPTPEGAQPVQADARQVEDFAAPYAADVAAVNAATLSQNRMQLLREVSAQMGVDSFMVRDTPNIRWLTAVDGVFDEERAHALIVTPNGACLHTDSRYANALRTQLAQMGSPIAVNEDRVGHMDFARAALAGEGGTYAGKMAIEDTITYAEYVKAVQAMGIGALAASTDTVIGLRAVKSNAELSRMLAAQAVTDAAFVHIVQFMKPGMTEREVQLELEDYMLRHGAEGLAFSSIVATGANGADPHAIPGGTRLEAGQCVVMDFGAKAFGYCSDMTRMVFLGQPDERLAGAYAVLRHANESVEATLRPGMTGKEAHELAEQLLAEGGFAGKMGHGLGHGVGLEVHEQPVLNTRNEQPLVVGNVVTVEPGIYLPGEFGMRLEDCGVITPNGYEVFSQIGHDMVIV